MSGRLKRPKKAKKTKINSCFDCGSNAHCCRSGTWADLEEAKKIVGLGLKGEFFQLEKDDDFPSGFRIGTSIGYDPCSFLEANGHCSIHKIDFHLKPKSCKEFPYENDKVAPYADELCPLFRSKKKKKRRG